MTQAYTKSVLRVVVAQICQTIGWHTIQNSALEILVDILHHYIQDLSKLTHRYSEHYGYTVPNLDHLALAFRDLGINLDELEEYVQFVEPVPCSKDVPKFPIPRESHLNFLKPGSREVVHRPVHVHEHLPPMHPEMEEDEYNGKQNANPAETTGSSNGSSPLSSPKAGVFKRPGEPISAESSAARRARSAPEEEGRPLREITSVIMTTSGFLSPAREGKLPESHIPIPPSDSRSNSPQPPSYPMVPPEVKGEKKSKKGTIKKSIDGLKRLDKENKKKEMKSKEAKKSQKHMLVDDSKVKKLISMKEVSKLKALKTGALKSMARSTSGGSGSKSKLSSSKLLSKSHSKAFKFNKISSQPKLPKVDKSHQLPIMPPPKTVIPVVEKSKSSKIIEGKLSSEPNKEKLNIFKKISKVKEEKFDKDKVDRIVPAEMYPKDSRESSPDLVIDESDAQVQQRKARLAQLDECIDEVIMRGMKETTHDSKQVREGKLQVISMPGCVSKTNSSVSDVVVAHGSEPHKDVYMFEDNDLSPPGTPSTPKTPDFPTLSRKLRKMSEIVKKKPKSLTKKESKGKLAKELLIAKKLEVNDYENSGRPKTPEVPEPQENVQTPVFPFFPSFPPAPGLIPPPLGHHPLFPRFPLPYTKPVGVGQSIPSSNLPHPAMPNLPLPPPLFMQPRAEEPPKVKEESPEKTPPVSLPPPPPAPLPPVVKTEKIDKPQPPTPQPVVTPPKEKSSEKKCKEHKKEKKDKVKKKKEKKDKSKSKEKSEKKKEKEEKKEREKDKAKEKKKEKKKDKEREEKSETSVPKLTLKLPPSSSPRPSTPDQSRKIVIKTVVKKSEESAPLVVSNEPSSKRAPSPELAKFSALITRPPKQKGSSKPPPPHPEPMPEPVSYHHPPPPPMPPPQQLSVPVTPIPTLPPEPPATFAPPPPPVHTPSPMMPVPVPSMHMLQSTSATPLIAPPKAKKATKPFSKSKPKDGSKKSGLPEQDAPKAFYYDKQGNKVWICPACGGQDDGSPMIGCDDCDAWYHWVCVGMQVPPDDNEDWYCRVCIVKKEESLADKKKKVRKKK